jgi:probable O-glycosylation ligase (exosortase A-associated)
VRDLVFVAFILALFGLALRRPFLFVLAYAYIDIVAPQRLSYHLLSGGYLVPLAAMLAMGSWLLFDDKKHFRIAGRQWLMLLLLFYAGWTTFHADMPYEALDKWDWVWKSMVFAIFLPFTLRTRLRIESYLLVMILSASAIVIVGGIKTLLSGGGYGALNLMVANNSGLYEGSTISTVAVALVPLILWASRYNTVFPPEWRVKAFAAALVFACLLIPVGTEARTGLVCIGVLAVLMLRDARRRFLYIGLIGLASVVAVPMLPSSFTERMNTISTYQGDSSASTRIAVWRWTWNYAQEDAARAYHSSYFEMLGEQGFPGIFLFLLIHGLGLVRMEVLRRRWRGAEGDTAWISPLATALQSFQIIYLVGSLFVGIAFQPFVWMALAVQIGFDSYVTRRHRPEPKRPLRPLAPALASG